MLRTNAIVCTSFLLVGVLGGCNQEPLVPDGTGGITGEWTFLIDVTVATGACADEEAAPVDTSIVSVVQAGDSVSATGPWGSTSGSETLRGTRSGDVVTFFGIYEEDGGATTATYNLTATDADETMTGSRTGVGTGREARAAVVSRT